MPSTRFWGDMGLGGGVLLMNPKDSLTHLLLRPFKRRVNGALEESFPPMGNNRAGSESFRPEASKSEIRWNFGLSTIMLVLRFAA